MTHSWKDEHDKIKATLKALVERLDFVHETPAYKSVWVINHLHVGPYSGPTYEAELNAAREAVRRLTLED